MNDKINDDVFEYSNGFCQCISGFGRNAIDNIMQWIKNPGPDEPDQPRDTIEWHIGELVRWCRGLNRKAQELERELAKLKGQPAIATAGETEDVG